MSNPQTSGDPWSNVGEIHERFEPVEFVCTRCNQKKMKYSPAQNICLDCLKGRKEQQDTRSEKNIGTVRVRDRTRPNW